MTDPTAMTDPHTIVEGMTRERELFSCAVHGWSCYGSPCPTCRPATKSTGSYQADFAQRLRASGGAVNLTHAQRRCVLKMTESAIHPNDIFEQGGRMAALVKRGIAYRAVCTMRATDESFNGYGLTPLGLALRTHLGKEPKT